MADPRDPRVPIDSVILGYGPMLPLLAAGVGAWLLHGANSLIALSGAITWGALILAFIGGVRRGFGFGYPPASKPVEIATSALYLGLALLALVVPSMALALGLLVLGYAAAALLDRRAALVGDAPAHFARLRPTQLLLGALGLALALARTLV